MTFEGVSEYCFTSLSAQSWQYRDRRKPKTGSLCPTLISINFKGSLQCSAQTRNRWGYMSHDPGKKGDL